MRARATATSCAFLAPDYKEMEVFAHIGGQPLGMAFDRNDNLYVCIGGMGLYRITPERKVEKVTDETNRSLYSVNDDSRLRLADDLDIADDGRIFFSEATVRYEMHEWPVDGLEARGNGRIICYDPNTEHHAHGAARPEIPQRHLHRQRRPSRSCSPKPSAAASAVTGSTARRPATPRW